MIVAESRSEYFDWANERLGTNFCAENAACAAVIKNSEIQAIIIFHNWVQSESRLDVSFVTNGQKEWPNRSFGRFIIDYVFGVLNVNRFQFVTPVDNTGMTTLGLALGFTHEATLTDWYGPGRSGLLFYMLKENIQYTNLWRMSNGIPRQKLH